MAIKEMPIRNDLYSYDFSINLENVPYNFEIKYNNRLGHWVLNILDENKNPLVYGLNLLTETDFYAHIIYNTLPPGLLFLIDSEGQQKDAGIDDFANRIKMLYEESVSSNG